MKTLTAVALAAVVVASVSSADARMATTQGHMMGHGTMPSAQGHMMRERQMMSNQMKHGAMLGMGPLSAEGNQNLLFYYGGPCAPKCEPTCAPVCEAPCPPAPVCEPVCEPVCAPVCEAPCPPEPCPPKPLCCQDFRGWFDGYQCPCPTNYVATVPCGC